MRPAMRRSGTAALELAGAYVRGEVPADAEEGGEDDELGGCREVVAESRTGC